ncbi:MAG: lipoate--protein ligase family protein [Chloroflexi bacterium]|nr:lipoate--protein ligase family protein [Chloroflexota bacterium]
MSITGSNETGDIRWRWVDTGYADAHTNMACDEAILLAYGEGLVSPTVRFYGWQPPGLSLGYFQRIEEVDLDACRRLGIDVVRRTTGGRAILHDKELTYSLVANENDPLVSGDVVESYRKISLALVAGLRLLGVEAELAPEVPPGTVYHGVNGSGNDAGAPLGSSACFDAPCSYELTFDHKKLVGSAQARSRGLILQHGSVLIDFDASNLVQVFKMSDEGRDDLRRKMESRAVSLSRALGKAPDRQELIEALVRGFGSQLGVTLERGELTAQERQATARLAQEKYRSTEWIHRR